MDNSYNFIDVLTAAWTQVLSNVVSILPEIIGALIVFIIGLIVAPIVGGLVRKLIEWTKIDNVTKDEEVKSYLGGFADVSLSNVVGKLAKWFIVIVSLVAAADILGWNQVTSLLNEILLYIPQVIIAVVVLGVGIVAAQFVGGLVGKATSNMSSSKMLAKVAKTSVVIFSALVALIQLGIAPSLIEILFGGFVLALALAFGLGGREKAAEILNRMK